MSNEIENMKPEHPVKKAIELFVHKIIDHKRAAAIGLRATIEKINKDIQILGSDFKKAEALSSSDNPANKIIGTKEFIRSHERLKRLQKSHVINVVQNSLFLGLFSTLDAFVGDLILALYTENRELFANLNRSVTYKDLLATDSIQSLRDSVILEEIETLRRKSYQEQFEYLENRFDLSLTKFENYPKFIESAQRRNLMAHCNGLVSDQYIKSTIDYYSTSTPPKPGDILQVEIEYYLNACELILEVGVKLGHTLWRKTLPAQLNQSDDHLIDLIYDFLLVEQFERARLAGEFALSQKRHSSDSKRRILLINYAIALKNCGDVPKSKKTVQSVDWSSCSLDLRIAESVLLENNDKIYSLMKEAGKNSGLLSEQSYHTWPLFNDLRSLPEFSDTYESIYGYPFVIKLPDEEATTHADTHGGGKIAEIDEGSIPENDSTDGDGTIN